MYGDVELRQQDDCDREGDEKGRPDRDGRHPVGKPVSVVDYRDRGGVKHEEHARDGEDDHEEVGWEENDESGGEEAEDPNRSDWKGVQ